MRASAWTLAAALGVLLGGQAVATPVLAQRRPPARAQQERADLERRVRARFGEMVRERLGLDQAQAARLDEVVRSFQEDRSRLAREEQAIRRRTEAILLEEASSEPEALELLERLRALRGEEARLFAEEQEALLSVLTPTQVLRLDALRQQLGRRIQQLRGGRGPGATMRGGGPGLEPAQAWDAILGG